MGRSKGTPKTGGRQAGTPNKVTGTIKDFLASVIDSSREQMKKDLENLEPKDRLMVLEKFMQYVIPRQQAVKADMDIQGINKELVIRYIGKEGDEIFPSSEDEIDL